MLLLFLSLEVKLLISVLGFSFLAVAPLVVIVVVVLVAVVLVLVAIVVLFLLPYPVAQLPTLHNFKLSPIGKWGNNINRGKKQHHCQEIGELEVIAPSQSSLAHAMNSLWYQLYFCDIRSFKWSSKEGKGRNALFWKHFESRRDTKTLVCFKETSERKMTLTVGKGFKLQQRRKGWIFVLLSLFARSFTLSLVHSH